MTIDQNDIEFINTKFKEIDGWCGDDAAYLTLWLMKFQLELGNDSPVLEIGVYKGKYLSVLYHQARRTAQSVVGIDTFQWSSREDLISIFRRLFGSVERLSLVSEDSSILKPSQVIEMLGGKQASFISVDGDHSPQGVQSDLMLSKALLSDGGIVAVDDFLNPKAIGVSEGFYRFCFETAGHSLRPFVYCANKLFCADRAYYDMYTRAIWTFVEKEPDLPMVKEFNRQLQLGRAYVEQELLGARVLIF